MSNNTTKPKCCGAVYKPQARRLFPCSHFGSIQRGEKWYCKLHDPVAREQRSKDSWDAFQTRCKTQQTERQRELDCLAACAGLADPAEALRLARESLSAMLAWTDGVAGDNQNQAAAAQELAAFNLAKQALSALTPNKPE